MMKKAILLAPVLMIMIASCKDSKKEMLTRKWQAVSIYNPQMDSLISEQEKFIDTFGRNNDATTNELLYGVRNIDSLRESMKTQLADYKAMQDHSLKNTWFRFKENGVALMNFSGHVDSSKWYIENKNELILNELDMKGAGEKITMIIEELTDTALKLQFNDQGMSSTITFHPVTN